MWRFPRCVMGKLTRKSIETNSIGELGNDLIPIPPGFRFKGFTEIHAKEKPTRKTCFSREMKRLAPRIYLAKF